MGYDIAIPAGLLLMLVIGVFAVLFARRRGPGKRLDFQKGTTYEEPQEEGPAGGIARPGSPGSEGPPPRKPA